MTFIKGIASAAAILIGLSAPAAHAGYIVDLTQQGSDVVATGSGAIDLTGLSFFASFDAFAILTPAIGLIIAGPTDFTLSDVYRVFTGPSGFGSGALMNSASSGTGDVVGINATAGTLFFPSGYASGAPLSDTATWNGQTLSSLGVTPGVYKWTWGSGPNQNFTLVAGVAEPSTWAMMLLGFAGLSFYPKRRETRGKPKTVRTGSAG